MSDMHMHPASARSTAPGRSDALVHVRTNELTNADTSYQMRDRVEVGNARGRTGFVYIVHWPEAQFTKVGCSVDGRRWRPFLRRGGELLGALAMPQDRAGIVEWQMHVELATLGVPRRFSTQEEARPYLGGVGRGFTECWVDTTGRDVLHHLMAWAARRRGA